MVRHGIQIRTGVFRNSFHYCNSVHAYSRSHNPVLRAVHRLDPDARQYPGYLIPLQKAIQFQNASSAHKSDCGNKKKFQRPAFRTVVCDSEQLQPFSGGCFGHIRNRTGGSVATCDRMRMYIRKIHEDPSLDRK